MKRFLALVFCLLSFPALAGGMMPDIVFATPSVAAPVFPGDIVSGANVFYGLRAYSAAEAAAGTQKMINIINGNTSETCDVLVASNGGLGLTANCSIASNGVTPAVFCSGATCSIVTLYDQSGANYCTGVPCDYTPTVQPTLTFNCFGSLPCWSATGGITSIISFPTFGPPWSATSVVERTGNFTTEMYTPLGNFPGIGFSATANNVEAYCSGPITLTVAANDNALHALSLSGSAGSCTLAVDGVGSTATLTVHAWDISLYPFYRFYGNMAEEGVWPVAFTSGQQTTLCHNQYLYWGTSVSC